MRKWIIEKKWKNKVKRDSQIKFNHKKISKKSILVKSNKTIKRIKKRVNNQLIRKKKVKVALMKPYWNWNQMKRTSLLVNKKMRLSILKISLDFLWMKIRISTYLLWILLIINRYLINNSRYRRIISKDHHSRLSKQVFLDLWNTRMNKTFLKYPNFKWIKRESMRNMQEQKKAKKSLR
jgi:hypothetical protein